MHYAARGYREHSRDEMHMCTSQHTDFMLAGTYVHSYSLPIAFVCFHHINYVYSMTRMALIKNGTFHGMFY